MKWLERTAIILAAVALISVMTVNAQPLGAESVTPGDSSRLNTSSFTPDSVDAQAGNVTELSINATSITKSWAGFYGNVTGNLVLADSSGNNFYDWELSTPSGEVYASRSDAVTWSNINCSNTTHVADEEQYLGQSSTDPDSVSNTFAATSHPDFLTGTRNMTGCFSTQAYNNAGTQGTGFWQILLHDESDVVYSTIIDDVAELGFNNLPWHFQLLVGENGKIGNEDAMTPYYFYVELQ